MPERRELRSDSSEHGAVDLRAGDAAALPISGVTIDVHSEQGAVRVDAAEVALQRPCFAPHEQCLCFLKSGGVAGLDLGLESAKLVLQLMPHANST